MLPNARTSCPKMACWMSMDFWSLSSKLVLKTNRKSCLKFQEYLKTNLDVARDIFLRVCKISIRNTLYLGYTKMLEVHICFHIPLPKNLDWY
jgi:hypothetical protein